MSYRFLHVATSYKHYVELFLARQTDIAALSYDELLRRFIDTRFGLASDFFVRHMIELGNPAELLIGNLDALQARWAQEHGLASATPKNLKRILIEQARAFAPDVILFGDLYFCDRQLREELRAACPKQTIQIGWRAAQTRDFGIFDDLDLILTVIPAFVERFRSRGLQTELFAWAFDAAALGQFQGLPRDLDFTFAGITGKPYGSHSRRYMLIDYLLGRTGLHVWGQPQDHFTPLSRRFKKLLFQVQAALIRAGVPEEIRSHIPVLGRAAAWKADPSSLPLDKRHMGRIHDPLYGLDYLELMGRSKIALNCHTDVAEDRAGNVRLFEATGMGACLLTEWQENLSDFFVPDQEVAVYRSPAEAAEKAAYLLEHEEERLALARAGQARTLRDHTYVQRTSQLDEIIQKMLKRGRAKKS